jgi:hypothetical protein
VDPYKDKKWSFARIDNKGLVLEVKEKVPILTLPQSVFICLPEGGIT